MMLRKSFDRELQGLNDRLLALGSEVESNIIAAVKALTDRNHTTAGEIIVGDLEVNQKRIDIMTDALSLIATQQPMAGDLRLIASIIEMAGELERINDYSKGIAKNSLLIGEEHIPVPLDGLTLMAGKTAAMLHEALEAASHGDLEAARLVPAADDEIDDLFNKIYREIMDYIVDDPGSFGLLNNVEWALHNLERAADRVTNICEWVVYTVTGEYIEMDSELEAPPPQS
jgi:phosphate transport system protein